MSKMKSKISLFTFALLSLFQVHTTEAQELSCPSSLSVDQIAHSLIKVELSGIQLEDLEGSSCLDQAKFPHLLIVGDYSNEAPPALAGIVQDMTDVKVLNVKEIDPDVHLYEASFEMKVDKVEGMTSLVDEKIRFMLYKDADAQKNFGCAGIIEHTQKVYLLKQCQKKN